MRCRYNTLFWSNAIDLMDSHTVVDTSKKAIDNVKDFVRGSRAYLNFTGVSITY